VKFTVVELAGGAELAAPVEKAAAGPAENVAASLHTVQVESDLCVGELHPGHRELCAGGFNPSHGELGRRSARCVQADSTRELHAGELHPGCGELGSLRPSQDECERPREHVHGRLRRAQDEHGQPPPAQPLRAVRMKRALCVVIFLLETMVTSK
jgi:hypothetical protein